MTIIDLEASRSKYAIPDRLAVPPELPAYTASVFIIFRGLSDFPEYVGRHFRVEPDGLWPLATVRAGSIAYVRATLIPEGSSRYRGRAPRHPSAYEIWLPRLGYDSESSPAPAAI